jgi:ribonuclease HI
VLSGAETDTTNNRMELQAAISALEALSEPSRVELHTDSSYLKQGITEWLPSWVIRGWRKSDGRPVLNVDLWRRLHRVTQQHDVRWHWVQSHSGDPLNERVDCLAYQAMQNGPGR